MWPYRTAGIPDSEFERDEGVPITKEEVRAVQIGKARLREGDTVYDIGCGSGSVTVEAALQVGPGGAVHAVDVDPRAAALTRRNLARFGVGNAEVTLADAREAIPGLPEAGAALVGGTGGATAEVISLCGGRLREGGRIVVGAITIETVHAAVGALGAAGFADVDVAQVAVTKGRLTRAGTMMLARNPVTVVSATRSGAP